MGLFDFLNKPSPQVMRDALNEAVKKSQEYARNGDRENALKVLVEHKDWGWNAYKEALFSKMPFLRETLRAGVSEDSIKAAEAEIGAAFPSELKGLYLTNDGDNNEALCGMMLGFRFLSLQAMLTEWRSMKAIAEYAGKRWLPFGSDNGGNFIAVSLDPDNSGKTGQVINFGRDERVMTVIADSLGALFERFTRIVNSRDFYIGEYDGEDVILLGTDDVDEGSYLTDYLKSENSVK